MEQRQLEDFYGWFDEYVRRFYGDDEYVNANLRLKERHSRRVCEEMEYLADALGLKENQKRIAEAAALLHDVGRFEQFIKYNTYSDTKSVNHGRLGLEVLKRKKVLERIEAAERRLIEKAIECHVDKELDGSLDGEELLLCRLVRDADKLDVFYVATSYYIRSEELPEVFELEMEFPEEPWYSPELVEGIMAGRQTDYGELQTMNDMKLLHLGWIYDVNFVSTLKRIRKREFLEKIIGVLPKDKGIEMVEKKIFDYVDGRIRQES